MSSMQKIAIFGVCRSWNMISPMTAALLSSGFQVTAITRQESFSTFPPAVSIIKSDHGLASLTEALAGHDAAVCVVGPGAMALHVSMIDAALAAGLSRFIINDFGWGPDFEGEPEFQDVEARRQVACDHAAKLAASNPTFTWTGITIGNPIDWALPKFALMGFDLKHQSAVVYDKGREEFTGTTLDGIGQPGLYTEATVNRYKVRSILHVKTSFLRHFNKPLAKVGRFAAAQLVSFSRVGGENTKLVRLIGFSNCSSSSFLSQEKDVAL